MQKLLLVALLLAATLTGYAQSPVGHWKVLSHIIDFDGQKIDMHDALLKQRPCASKIFYEINEDKTYRLNAASSGCEERYKSIQEKLYSKTQWKLEGTVFTTSATNFEAGQSYTISFSGNKMTWMGTDGQGTIVYEKL